MCGGMRGSMKKNLLTVLILALMIVNIVLTTIIMVSVISANKKTSDLVGNIATALNLELAAPGSEGEGEKIVSLANTETYQLPDELMIGLSSVEGSNGGYMIFNLSLSMDIKGDGYKKYGENVSAGAYDSIIEDTVSSIIGSYTEEECRNNIEQIKSEILQAIQGMFDSTKFIYRVNITGTKFGGS